MKNKTITRREFVAASAVAGSAILVCTQSTEAQEKKLKKTFTILHTNDMHSAFIGMAPSSDYTPFTLNDDSTRGGYGHASNNRNRLNDCTVQTEMIRPTILARMK